MVKAVLTDIDNTLIYFDEARYFQSYLTQVSKEFTDIMPFETFRQRLMVASQSLLKNNGEMSNAEYFMNSFSRGYENYREEIWKRFLNFYHHKYEQFRSLVTVPENVSEIFRELQNKQFKLVIASNPLWPLIVQQKRLAWAGISDIQFIFITHIENTSFCKPRLGYYREICQKIGEQPGHCLMIGDDPVNDMIAATIGMKTFLVNKSSPIDQPSLSISQELRDHTDVDVPPPDFEGDLAEVLKAVQELDG